MLNVKKEFIQKFIFEFNSCGLSKSLKKEQIAKEKAGIIKPGILTISAQQKQEVVLEIKKVAKQKKTKVFFYKDDFCAFKIYRSQNGISFNFEKYNNIQLSQLAKIQIENAVLAIKSYQILADKLKYEIKEVVIKNILKSFELPGRMQIIAKQPLTILDGAHNIASISALVDTLNEVYPNKKINIIFSAMQDKDIVSILFKLSEMRIKEFIFIELSQARAIKTISMRNLVAGVFPNLREEKNIKKAYTLAKYLSHKKDLIVIVGSLYLVGETIKNKNILFKNT